jgi:DNA adenine methylase
MKPILKWSGGKSEELEKIKKYIPDNIDTYIEPFIGGGALYFYLNHSKNVINDIHKELIAFYNSIKKGYSNEIYEFMKNNPNDEITYYKVREKLNKKLLNEHLNNMTEEKKKHKEEKEIKRKNNILKKQEKIDEMTEEDIEKYNKKKKDNKKKNILEKLKKQEKIDEMTEEDIEKYIEEEIEKRDKKTEKKKIINNALTTISDDEVDDDNEELYDLNKAKYFYYLRKTTFRGMLRYSTDGKFNIPFGRYKTINFDSLKNENYEKILKNTEIYNSSFEKIIEKYDNSNNFMFLDPPYDSEFTDYGYCSFGRDEHKKLAECLKKTKTRWLMVIGKTDFIEELYSGYIVDEYHKNYKFKLHSDRVGDEINTQHLVIKNY